MLLQCANGGDAAAKVLIDLGVEVVFTLTGGHLNHIHRTLEKSQVRLVDVRHEQAATFMADAYARMTGKPGVAMLTAGPGFTNCISPLQQAATNCTPLLIIAGASDTVYRDKIDHYINPVLGNIPLGKLTGQDVQQWVNQISRKSPASGNPISPKSVRNVLLVLRPALDRAVDLHLIQENPAARVVLPKREHYHPKVYADTDIRKMLIAAHGTDLYFPLMLALFTGMRRGELIALRWQDVDFSEKKLYVRHSIVSVQGVPEMKGPKTESGKREIALSDRIIDLLKEQFDRFPRSEYVVCQKNGQPFSPDAFSRKFQRFLSRNHLPHLRLHDLRHASATLMIEHGVDIKTVQIRLGHSDISTTLNIYSHMTEQMNRNAADKLDEVLFSK